MKKKNAVVLLALIIAYMIIPTSVSGDEEHNNIADDIIMEAQVGFEGYFRLEQWTPITVEIENKGENIEGTIEVAVNQGSNQAVIFSRPAVIPKNSKKQFVLYVQVNSIQKEMNIRLVQEGKIIKTHEVRGLIPFTWQKYFLGVITEDKAGMNYWWNVLSNDRIFANHETVHMDVQNIPDRKEILDNFAVLVFNNADTSLLTEEQKTALSSWIEDGGIIIVGTGTNGNKTLSGLYPDVVPLNPGDVVSINSPKELSQIAEVNLSNDALFKIMNISSNAGEIILQSEEGYNLIWKHEIGEGYVFVSAFDLGLEPIVSWAGNKVFWAKLLPVHLDADAVNKLEKPEMQKDIHSNSNIYSQINEALASISAMEMPSFSGLIILLLAYLAVVGPLNYIILKKLDKREWAWLTIPLIVILFSAGIYAMGYTKKGNEVIVNTISAVKVKPEGNFALVDTHIGVFIPKKGDYTIDVNKDALITAFNDDYMEYTAAVQDGDSIENKYIGTRVNQGESASVEIYDANIWTMKAFTMSSVKEDFGRLESDLYYHDGKIEGLVTNSTPYPLDDLVVYTRYGYQKLGNIASGQSKQVSFTITPSTSSSYQYESLYRMVDEIYPNITGGLSSSLSDEERDRQVKRRILQGLLVRPMESKLGTNSYGSFIKAFAFSDANLGEKIEVNGKNPEKLYYKTLVMADLDVVYEKDGLISIPPGLIKGTVNGDLSDNIEVYPGGIFLPRGQAVFTFSMNPYREIEVYKLEINAGSFYGNPLLYLYDPDNEEFIDVGEGIEINQMRGIISIDPETLEKYIDDEGNLQIKIETKQDSTVNMEFPYLIIEGRRN